MDINGKNKAAIFMPVKETRTQNSIRKIKVSEEEETDDIMKIVKILEEKHKGLVGKKFKQDMDLEEFLDKYQYQFLKRQPKRC